MGLGLVYASGRCTSVPGTLLRSVRVCSRLVTSALLAPFGRSDLSRDGVLSWCSHLSNRIATGSFAQNLAAGILALIFRNFIG